MARIAGLVATLLLLCCLLANSHAQQYEDENFPGNASGSLPPCSSDFYTFNMTADPTVDDYIVISWLSSLSLIITVSDQPLYSTEAPTALYNAGGVDSSITIICPVTTVSQWYVTVENPSANNDIADYTITFSSETVFINYIDVNVVEDYTGQTFSPTQFSSEYSFYSFSFNDIAVEDFSEVKLSVTSAQSAMEILVNLDAIPDDSATSGNCVLLSGTDTITLDACQFQAIYANNPTALWYMAVKPLNGASPINFSVEIIVNSPSVTPLTVNGGPSAQQNLTINNDLAFFSFQSTSDEDADEFLSITAANVVGGSLTFSYSANQLPLVCAGISSGSCTTDTYCETVISPCLVQAATYYVAVEAVSFDAPPVNQASAIYYTISANSTEVSDDSDELKQGETVVGKLDSADYDTFEISGSGYSTSDETLLNVHIYLDQSTEVPVALLLTPDAPGNACNVPSYACTAAAGGSCTIQVDPCDYNDYKHWYASVLANSYNYLGTPTQYTIAAQLQDPYEITDTTVAYPALVDYHAYRHFSFSRDLLPEGGEVSVTFSSISGGNLDIFVNKDGLAGLSCCYGNTQEYTNVGSEGLTINVRNCNDDSDFFISAYGVSSANNAPVTFSVTAVAASSPIKPEEKLETDVVTVGSTVGFASANYTLNYDDKDLLVVKLSSGTLINDAAAGLTLSLYNTTYLACIESQLADVGISCSTGASGYCSIVVEPCILKEMEDLLVVIESSDDEEDISFSIEVNQFSTDATTLKSGEPVAATVEQDQYAHYQFDADGDDTLIIEVYFDNALTLSGGAAIGQLFVNTATDDEDSDDDDDDLSLAGQGPCYESVFSCQDADKCVFALSSCYLREGIFYFSVFTDSVLAPQTPLPYTITVTEKSDEQPIAYDEQTYFQLYENEIVYNTFTVDTNPAMGSVVLIQYSNVVQPGGSTAALQMDLAQAPPPSQEDESCPCFMYEVTLGMDIVYSSDYCQQTGTDWTLRAQAFGSDDADLITYGLYIKSFSMTPLALPSETPTAGSVSPRQYVYYKLDQAIEADEAVVVSVTNISGGSVSVYVSSDNPATQNCNSGTLCFGEATSCYAQLACQPGLDGFQFVSVYGMAANVSASNAISFDISVAPAQTTSLGLGKTLTGESLDATFIMTYEMDISQALAMTAPLVTVAMSAIDSQNNAVNFAIDYSVEPCGAALATQSCIGLDDCELVIPNCIVMANEGTTAYVTVRNLSGGDSDLTYTIAASVINIASTTVSLASENDFENSAVLASDAWAMFTVEITTDDLTVPSSLDVSISPNSLSYVAFNDYPGPDGCSESVLPLSLSSCCVQPGSYNIAVQNTGTTSTTFTVTAVLTPMFTGATYDLGEIAFANAVSYTSNQQGAEQFGAGEIKEFSFVLSETDVFASFYVLASLNTTFDLYLEHISVAGPQDNFDYCQTTISTASCITYTADDNDYELCNFPQCNYPGQFDIGTMQAGITLATAQDAAANVNMFVGYVQYVDIETIAGFQSLPPMFTDYYTLSIDDSMQTAGTTFVLNVNSTSSQYNVVLSSQAEGPCGAAGLYSCNGQAQCIIEYSTCQGTGDFYVTVESTATESITYTVDLTYNAITAMDLINANTTTSVIDAPATSYFYVDVPALDATQWATLYIDNSNGSAITAQWTFGSVGPYCFPSQNMCSPNTIDSVCMLVLYDCNLAEGRYYFEVSTAVQTDFTIGFYIYTATPVEVPVNMPVKGAVEDGEVAYYQFTLDRSTLSPGQSIEVTLDTECGVVDMYVGQGSIPGGTCSSGPLTTFTLSACDLLTNALADPSEDTYYVTIVGIAATFQQFQVPSKYTMSINVVGAPYQSVTLALNHPVTKSQVITADYSSVMVFPVPGMGEFMGHVVIEAYQISGLTLSAGTFSYSLDAIGGDTFCSNVPTTACQMYNGLCAVQLDMCDVQDVRFIYIQWAETAPQEALLNVRQTNDFMRDLDLYDTYPQQGSVTPGFTENGWQFTDEEFYRISVNPSVYNFQLVATISTSDLNAYLLSSTADVPSICGNYQAIATTVGVDAEAQIQYDWCDLLGQDEVFFGVGSTDTEFGVNEAYVSVPYNLTVTSTTQTFTNVTADTDACYTMAAGEVMWLGLEDSAGYAPNRVIEVSLHSMDSLVEIYIDGNGLATRACSPNGYFVTQATTLEYSCPYTQGLVTVGIYAASDMSFFMSWTSTTADITALTVGTPLEVQASVDASYNYEFTMPALDMPQLVTLVAVGGVNSMEVSGVAPPSDCSPSVLTFCGNGGCAYSLSQCDAPASTVIYVTLSVVGDFTLSLETTSFVPGVLALNSFVEGSFAATLPGLTPDPRPSLQVYTITVAQSDLDAGVVSSLALNVYGVNQGTIYMDLKRSDNDGCSIIDTLNVVGTTGSLSVPSCQLVAGDYYLSVVLPSNANADCSGITYGVQANLITTGTANNVTALTNGTPVSMPVVDASSSPTYYFSYSGGANSQVLEFQSFSSIADVQLTVQVMFEDGTGLCTSTIATGVDYLQCNVADQVIFAVTPSLAAQGSAQNVKPGTTFTVQAKLVPVTAVSNGESQTASLTTDLSNNAPLSQFFSFDFDNTESFDFEVDVTSGSAVTVELLTDTCVTVGQADCECPESGFAPVPNGAFTCYFGSCQVPISLTASLLPSGTYYARVSGNAPTQYTVGYASGADATCFVPASSDFCDVDYATWGVGMEDDDGEAQNQAAIDAYTAFAYLFTADIGCGEISAACNSSLIEFACGLTYPACDENGFQTSTCAASCRDVEENCGVTMEQVGLSVLSCSHNSYLQDDDEICSDIYGVVDDGMALGWKIFLIVLAVIVGIIVIVLLLVIVAFVGRAAYTAHLAPAYDIIDDVGAYDDGEVPADGVGDAVNGPDVANYGAVESAPPAEAPPAPPAPPAAPSV